MKILQVETWRESVPLSRPYEITGQSTSEVDLFFARLISDDGRVGLGSASPSDRVTGETVEACEAALRDQQNGELVGRDARHLGGSCRFLAETMQSTPAARAALDMALHDLFAQVLEVPLVDVLGRCHESLPTSITIGIKNVAETLEECDEYLGRGFRCLKVKLGRSFEEDVERLEQLRARGGPDLKIRVDVNEGYTVDETLAMQPIAARLELEFVEQPLPRTELDAVRGMPDAVRSGLAMDENLVTVGDAVKLAQQPHAASVWVLKLMKCGGVTAARRQAAIAEAAGIDLMWGCMDESAISIAAALHTAYACPATRYLDLDGSFDLARDPAMGGFEVEEGVMRLVGLPGLGVKLCHEPP